MDNPHASSSLSYLAGVWDGDGCLEFARRKINGYTALIPTATVDNVDLKLVQYCRTILEDIGIQYNFYANSKRIPYQPVYFLLMRSQSRVRKFLEAVYPKLVRCREKADIILDFIRYRNKSSRDYGAYEFALADKFIALKGKVTKSRPDGYVVDTPYIAGLIDTDGCVTLDSQNSSKAIVPKIHFLSTDPVLADLVADWCVSQGVNPWRHSKLGAKKGYRQSHTVVVAGVAKSLRCFKTLQPYLVSKRAQAEIVMDFSERRLVLYNEHKSKTKYSGEDFDAVRMIRALNLRGVRD